ncbi:hypothetical protein PR202_gb23946 [Eleusine coracana subsp. coracana]|uniref:Agenet domain-containing protein n=1 Tax=Eleusine coracana subsp. coracana TaxID=191504 RepID=A0AAV5FHI0_ELECO|nr:hypothetical protein PR202_gb23946 [Eleusine coracana subsp. coracana]
MYWKNQKIPNVPAVKAIPSSVGPGGREPITKINPPGSLPSEGLPVNPLIGRKVMTRWPDDNSFYEAVITDYNPVEDRYVLVYDIDTAHESWEWVDFKEMAPEDVKWEDGDPGINLHGHGVPVRGGKKSSNHVGGPISGAGRGRAPQKNSFKKEFPPSQNGVGKKSSDYIEILHTDFLIKEVERVFSASHPDPVEMERAKKVLKEHEQSLIDAIARLAEASDGESDDRLQSLEYNRGWQNPHGRRYGDDMAMDGFLTGDADAM